MGRVGAENQRAHRVRVAIVRAADRLQQVRAIRARALLLARRRDPTRHECVQREGPTQQRAKLRVPVAMSQAISHPLLQLAIQHASRLCPYDDDQLHARAQLLAIFCRLLLLRRVCAARRPSPCPCAVA